MKTYNPLLLLLIGLAFSFSGYSQNDTIGGNKSGRKVIIKPATFKDSTLISISGIFDLRSLKISILRKNGHSVMEFIPKQIPFYLEKGNLEPGVYYVRCVDKNGRIPSKKMKIEGETPAEPE